MYYYFFEAEKGEPAAVYILDINDPKYLREAEIVVFMNEYGYPEIVKT